MVLTKELYTTSSKSGSRSSPSYRVTFRFVPREGEAVRGTAGVNEEGGMRWRNEVSFT